MRARTVFAAAATSMLLITVVAAPAYANDVTLVIDRPATTADPDARAHWDDLTDTLCVKAKTGRATAFFERPNGTWVSVTDRPGGGNTCTGNLSIKEDYLTTLYLHHVWNGTAIEKRKDFYT